MRKKAPCSFHTQRIALRFNATQGNTGKTVSLSTVIYIESFSYVYAYASLVSFKSHFHIRVIRHAAYGMRLF